MALKRTGVELIADGQSKFLSDVDRANKAVTDFGRDAEKAGGGVAVFDELATGAIRHVGVVAIEVAAEAAEAIKDFVGDSIDKAGDFEAGMNRFASVTGDAVEDAGLELEDFRDRFIEIGKELPVSTAAVQDAAVELAKGGVDVAQIMGDALEATLSLAAAGEVELAPAAEITAKALGVWGDEGVTATEIANRFAQAANASTVGVEDLALGFYNSQGAAKAMGESFEGAVTTLALIAPGFSNAATAGTSYNNFLARLQPSTDPATAAMAELGLWTEKTGSAFFDAQGSFVGGAQAAELLKQATEGLTDAEKASYFQTIFGNDAKNAAFILAEQGAAGYDAMAASMATAGTAAEQAAAKQTGFNTALDNAGGSVEALQITIGAYLLPLLTTLLNDYIAPAINSVSSFAQAFFESGDKVGFLVTKAGELIPGFTTLITVGGQVYDFLTTQLVPGAQSLAGVFVNSLQPSSAAIADIWQTLLLPALLVAGAFIQDTVVPAVKDAATAVNIWYQENGGLEGILKDVAAAINVVITGVQGVIQFVQESVAAQSILVGVLAAMATRYALVTAASIAHAVATKAITIATAAMTAAQGLLNAVMAANPIGLLIIVLGGLAAALVYAYNHSETMRESIRQAGLDFQRGLVVIQEWAAGVQKRFGEVVADFKRGWDLITTNISNAWDTIKKTVSDKLGEIVAFFTELPARITKALGDVAAIGRGIVDGIKAGISGAWASFMGWIDQQIAKIPKAIRDFLGISSPAKMMIPIGEAIPQGIKRGVELQLPALQQTLIGGLDAILIAARGQVELFGGIVGDWNRMVDSIRMPNFGGGGGGNLDNSPFLTPINYGGKSVSPPASPSQQAGGMSYSSSSVTNYNYAPTYGGAPNQPSQDFHIMRALGGR